MIISLIYILLYLFTCWITMRGLFRLSSTGGPMERSKGLVLFFIGGLCRFIILYIAWSGGFPLWYAILAQLLPILCLLVINLKFIIGDYIKDIKL